MSKNKTILIYTSFSLLISAVTFLIYDRIILKNHISHIEHEDKTDFLSYSKLIQSYFENIYQSNYDDIITIPPEELNGLQCNIKTFREYTVAFNITQIDSSFPFDNNKLKKLLALNNVNDASYCLFYNESQNERLLPNFNFDPFENTEKFLKFKPNQELKDDKNNKWQFLLYRKLSLDIDKTYESAISNSTGMNTVPVYPNQKIVKIGEKFDLKPLIGNQTYKNFDSLFFYDPILTKEYNPNILTKRIFHLTFQPPYKSGWYKLRIFSNSSHVLSIAKHDKLDFGSNTGVYVNSYEKWCISKIFGKLNKYGVPDYQKLVMYAHEDTNLRKFNNDLSFIKHKINTSGNNKDDYLFEMYKNIINYFAKRINKFSGSNAYIDYNIFVMIPKFEK